MSSSSELILAIGLALFGAQWKRGLGRALNVNERTINRWVAPEPIEPRADNWPKLATLMRERIAELNRLLPEVERRAAGER